MFYLLMLEIFYQIKLCSGPFVIGPVLSNTVGANKINNIFVIY